MTDNSNERVTDAGLPHEFTGRIVNGEPICKWCSGTMRECAYVFGPLCSERPMQAASPKPTLSTEGLVEDVVKLVLDSTTDGDSRKVAEAKAMLNARIEALTARLEGIREKCREHYSSIALEIVEEIDATLSQDGGE